jgi:hypothetical protein
MAKHRSVLGGLIGPTLLVGLLGLSCNNTQCESLRDELTGLKRQWTRCSDHSDCIKIGGNPGDCTGVMTCNFSVNRNVRLEAERRIASLPEETVDCTECTSPNCVAGDISFCEQVSGRCIIVTTLDDGGAMPNEGGASGSSAGD